MASGTQHVILSSRFGTAAVVFDKRLAHRWLRLTQQPILSSSVGNAWTGLALQVLRSLHSLALLQGFFNLIQCRARTRVITRHSLF